MSPNAPAPLMFQPGQTRLDLSAGLTAFPPEILALADSLEILDLSNNCLTELPDSFAQLKRLRIAFFNHNQFEAFPRVLAQCPNLSMVSFKGNRIAQIAPEALSPRLRWLVLTDNRLEALPPTIGQLGQLQKLMLAGNRLRSLPPELAQCHRLELIRLAANRLEVLPPWLLELPRLAWLAYGGNPCCQALATAAAAQAETELPLLDGATFQLGKVLGQGASGVIYQAQWTDPQAPESVVAIKQFKGDITSDGSPLDEMRACIAGGSHPNLVHLLGQLRLDQTQAALAFSLIPPSYRILGGPPSLESCTRDTYGADSRFELGVIVEIVQQIAAVVGHLHRRGILHGDLYAHNILVNGSGHSILSDFGAASFFDPADSIWGPGLERIEARAFGCLLEDLLDRVELPLSPAPAVTHSLAQLRQLQRDCMGTLPNQRPGFGAIAERLDREFE